MPTSSTLMCSPLHHWIPSLRFLYRLYYKGVADEITGYWRLTQPLVLLSLKGGDKNWVLHPSNHMVGASDKQPYPEAMHQGTSLHQHRDGPQSLLWVAKGTLSLIIHTRVLGALSQEPETKTSVSYCITVAHLLFPLKSDRNAMNSCYQLTSICTHFSFGGVVVAVVY
jgi:hypothetical protein